MKKLVPSEKSVVQSSVEDFHTEEEIRLRAILASSPDAITVADLNGNIIDCNQAALDLFEFSSEGELIGKSGFPFIAEKDHQRVMEDLMSILEQGSLKNIQYTCLTRDGYEFLAELSASVIKDSSGNPTGFVAITKDITERKKMEEALERQRDIAITLSGARNLGEALNRLFDNLLEIEEFDCAGFYLVDKETGALDMIVHRDLPDSFLEKVSHLEADSPYVKVIRDGKPIYQKTSNFPPNIREDLQSDDILSVVAIPIQYERKVIGDLNLASHTHDEISASTRHLLESVGAQIGENIVRARIEEELRKSESKSRTLLENLPQKIFFKDQKSVYITCNENYARDLKIKSDEIRGKTDYDFYPKKLAEKYRADDKRIMESGKTEDIEEEYIQDGQKAFVHTVKTPVKDENGNVVGTLGIFWDITERKRMEDALRRSEEKYRGIVELAPDGIATVDMKGRVTSVNTAFSRLTGYPKDEIVGKHFTKLGTIRPRDIPKYIKLLSSIYRGKIPPSLEFVYLRKDGTQRYGEARLSFMIQSGKKVGVQAILRDTTERKEMEEKLRQYSKLLEELVQKRTRELSESEKKYSVLVEEASDGVIILQDEKIVFSNEKFAEIIGYSKEESIGRTIEELVDEKHLQLVKKRYQQRLRGEKIPSTYEIEVIAKTSERVPIEVSAKRINYQGRAADLIIVRDIRERKLMEEQRLKLEKLETMGELATMVAHDLRNPLTSIRTANYYIKNTCPHHTHAECKTTREMLDIIEQETLFADNIINDLLDFATKRPLQKKKQNMNNLIETSSITSNIPENIKVKTKLDKKAIAPIDAKQLQRVFLNLTKNAVQAMPNGGKLTIKTTETKDHIEIAFTDTGVGIPEENMSKIFQPLFTTKAKGIGMGLAICKRIVEQHGGTIHVKSKAGQGTTFTIKLPKKEGKNNQ